jgi:phosphoribosylaminoimidazolecarboxamide formyltransferase/IMP cyclohydrolase
MTHSTLLTVRRALISVSDKTGLIELATALHQANIEILSTGNSAKTLKQANIPVIDISDYIQFPEILEGRVKTLHPKIHAGILSRGEQDADTLTKLNIPVIDLIVINLYPFSQTIEKPHTFEEAIENIDIGGPSMIRGAAKNHAHKLILTSPTDYPEFISTLTQNNNQFDLDMRLNYAKKAFQLSAEYEASIANYFTEKTNSDITALLPEKLFLSCELAQPLRYGENPQQQAALYKLIDTQLDAQSLDKNALFTLLQGKPLSYNNLLDSDAAYQTLLSLQSPAPTCVIVKHTNPCGVAIADNLTQAYQRAYLADPISAFGGIIALNQLVDEQVLSHILSNQFVEVCLAPGFTPEALSVAKSKPNVRLLCINANAKIKSGLEMKKLSDNSLLIQTTDLSQDSAQIKQHAKIVTRLAPDEETWSELLFAWQIAKQLKSNAIALTKAGQTVGLGAGQMSRVFSMEIALLKAKQAKLSTQGAVLASDAFFPFSDAIELAVEAGIKAIIQPGGSIRDAEVIEMANQKGIIMIFTQIRHFKH